MTYIICAIFTLLAAISDIRSRTISLRLILVGFAAAFILLITSGDRLSKILGLAAGVLFLGFSLIWKEHVGTGDGFLIAVIGLMVGLNLCVSLLLVAFILSATVGMGFVLIKKKDLKYSLPFAPFLFAGELLVFISEVAG